MLPLWWAVVLSSVVIVHPAKSGCWPWPPCFRGSSAPPEKLQPSTSYGAEVKLPSSNIAEVKLSQSKGEDDQVTLYNGEAVQLPPSTVAEVKLPQSKGGYVEVPPSNGEWLLPSRAIKVYLKPRCEEAGDAYPMFMRLYKEVGQKRIPCCGLTMIASRTALTAATCVIDNATNTPVDANLYRTKHSLISHFIIHDEADTTRPRAYQVALVVFTSEYAGKPAELPDTKLSLQNVTPYSLTVLSSYNLSLTTTSYQIDLKRYKSIVELKQVQSETFTYQFPGYSNDRHQVSCRYDMGAPTLTPNYVVLGVHISLFECNEDGIGEDILASMMLIGSSDNWK